MTALPARRNVEKPKTVRPEQPFVASHGEKIRIDAFDIERQRPDRLGCIHAEYGADATTCSPDCLEIDETAVGPMTMRDGDDPGRSIDEGEQRRGPIIIV